MFLYSLTFYLFSTIAVSSALMVISARNPVHSVLFLIFSFVNAAGLFVLLGAEFLAMILIVVYVGAVAVLFLFVVMMININFSELKSGFLNYLPFGSLIGLVILLELFIMVGAWKYRPEFLNTSELIINKNISNTQSIGNVIYTDYIHYFQISGVILLVAMIGAILLTFQKRDFLKRQNITDQVSRERSDSVIIKEVDSFKGVKIDD